MTAIESMQRDIRWILYLHDIKAFFITTNKHTAACWQRQRCWQCHRFLCQASCSWSIADVTGSFYICLVVMWYEETNTAAVIWHHPKCVWQTNNSNRLQLHQHHATYKDIVYLHIFIMWDRTKNKWIWWFLVCPIRCQTLFARLLTRRYSDHNINTCLVTFRSHDFLNIFHYY